MTVVVDTSVLVAAANRRDEQHDRAAVLVGEIMEGRHGYALTTDFILSEVVTVTLARTGRHREALEALDLVLPPDPGARWIALEWVGEETFHHALEAFRRSGRKELSFTDWTTVALVREQRAGAVVSFDRDFDGVVPRIG